jgi:CubicO group peptidase (beta-lactamase class C family)
VADLLTAAGLERFDEVATSNVGDDEFPGLVALVACADQVHVRALGTLSIGGSAVERDSLFRIASTTKPVMAAATLVLAGEGLFELDEPVDRLLPELADRRVLRRVDGPVDDTVPAARPITARDLLTFTFGFGMDAQMFASSEPWPVVAAEHALGLGTFGPPQPGAPPEPDTWIAGLGSLPLLAQPGERWLYNTGASVLGVMAARAAGADLGEVFRTRLFEPLGMRDTAFWTTETSRLATAYRAEEGVLHVYDAADGAWSRPPAFLDAAGGLVSTADDLLAFARMFLRRGDPVLGADQVAEMTSDHLTAEQRLAADTFLGGRGWGFGQAVATEGPHAGAFGWDGGMGTSWLVDPSRDLVVIVLTQRLWDNPSLPTIHRELQAAAYRALSD